MSNLKVLICGASIAGPATAYWLSKAGCKVTIIERFPELRKSGHNVDIRNLGVTIMRKMGGMEEAVLKKKVDLQGLAIINPNKTNGETCGVLRSTGDKSDQGLLSEFEIYRGDLSKILFDLTVNDEDINYIFGEEVSSIQTQPQDKLENGQHQKALVEFTNGLPKQEFDLVVDCGGSTSRTRSLGLKIDTRDYVNSVNSWSAYFSIPKGPQDTGNIGLAHNAPGGRFIAIDTTQPDSTRVVFIKCNSPTDKQSIEEFRKALKSGDGELKRYVGDVFRGSGWRTEEFIKGMQMDSSGLYAGEWLQVKLPEIYGENFAMVGDAGYASGPTGSGTSLALIGAYTLAGEIVQNQSQGLGLQVGLKAYNDRMKPIIEDLQQVPPFLSTIMAPQTSWGIWIKNTIFSWIAWSRVLEVAGKYLAPAFQSGDKYKLPEYPWKK